MRESNEIYGWSAPTRVKVPASAHDITEMQGLLWIDVIERRVVLGMAEGRRIERLAGENEVSCSEGKAAWMAGLIRIPSISAPSIRSADRQVLAVR